MFTKLVFKQTNIGPLPKEWLKRFIKQLQLSFLYVAPKTEEEVLPVEEALARLRKGEEARANADNKLYEVLQILGL